MKARRAGQRRQLIALQEKRDVETTSGFTSDWTTYDEVWASVEPVTASPAERATANTTQVPMTHLVEIDFDDRVKAEHRVLFNARPLYLVGPPQNLEERNKTLVLVCEERAA